MKRISFLVSIFLLLTLAAPCFSQWSQWQILKTAVDSVIKPSGYWSARTIAPDTIGTVHVVWNQWLYGDDISWVFYQRSTDGGAAWGSPVYLPQPGEPAGNPSIAADAQGNVHVVWLGGTVRGSGVVYCRSTDRGQTWQPETLLVDGSYYGSSPGEEKLIADENGNVYLLWSQGTVAIPPQIAYKHSSDGGLSWSPDTFLTSNTLHTHASVAIALDNQSRPHICWYEYPYLSAGQVWYQDAKDAGLTWNPPVLIADLDSTLPGDPNVAVDGLDRIYVFYTAYWWSDSIHQDRQIVYNVSEDTGRTFGPRRVLSLYPQHPINSVTVTGDVFGGVHAVWHDGTYLRYNGSTDGGRTWRYALNNPLAISDSLWEEWPSITSDSKGKVHLVAGGIGSNNTIYYGVYCNGYPLGVEENRQGDKETRGQGEKLRATPNPFTSFARIPGHETERFALYDITGRRVGTYKGDRIGEGLAAGVYFVRAEDNASKPLRIVKLR